MPTSHRVTLLILIYGCPVFNSKSDQEIDGNATSTSCWPKVDRFPYWGLRSGLGNEHGDDCPVDDFLVPTFPEDFDMKKMMGRWFVGMVSDRYPYHNPRSRKCIAYEFGRLILDNHTTSFNVTRTYQAKRHSGENWTNPEKNIGFMRSCGPINAKFMYKNSENPHNLETKFFIYKFGPQGKDSFGMTQHEYAVVGLCKHYPILIIARNPETFNDEHKKEVTKWLEDNGILRLWDWIQPDYSDCSFDSVAQDNYASVI